MEKMKWLFLFFKKKISHINKNKRLFSDSIISRLLRTSSGFYNEDVFFVYTMRDDIFFIGCFQKLNNTLICRSIQNISIANTKICNTENFLRLRDILLDKRIIINNDYHASICYDLKNVTYDIDANGNYIIDSANAPITELFAKAVSHIA